MKTNEWARVLAYVTGLINQQLLLQNEYLAAENRILRTQLSKRLRLTDSQRCTLAEIGKTVRPQGAGASRVREARHDSRVVPTTDRAEV
jgi:putative transposase